MTKAEAAALIKDLTYEEKLALREFILMMKGAADHE